VTTFKPTSAQSPFVHLLEHVTHVLERLKNSDIRALNRKLKRAFDITELSSMSNAVIENVLMDVDTLDSRFLWVEEDGFFPVLHLLRGMLKELGTLRTTINELQVEYVKKVEESEHRVEEEILQKRAMQKKQNAPQSSPLTWLTNMFYRTNVNNSIEPVPNDKGSTLTKTSTNSSSSQHTETGGDANNTPIQSRSTTLPRSIDNHKQRRRIPYPTMVTSLSTGTDSRSIPITATFRNNKRHIDSLATVLAVERDSEWQGGNLSSSWLGGK
jgi:Tfp pilus assembly protein PilV